MTRRISRGSRETPRMLHRLLNQLRSNAVAYVALFVALSGTAFAAASLPRNSVGTSQLKNRAVTGQKVALHTLTGANIKSSTLGTVPNALRLHGVTLAALQRAITGKCSGDDALQTILRSGKVTCHAFGTVTRVTAGTGLTGGGSSGDVILTVDPTVVQARVTGSCAGRGAMSSINQDGTINCHTTDLVQMMGGTGAATLSPTADYMAAVGLSTPSAQEQAVDVGSGNAPSSARHLFVRVETAPPSGGSWTFNFFVNFKKATGLTCTIMSPAKSCHANGSVSIPAGARIALHETATNITTGTTATYGWTDNTF
jgi:hypothetical protein